MNEKINLKVPINLLKKQFDQMAQSNLLKGNDLSSKQLMSYVQSIYAQIGILQQILAIDEVDNSDDDKNESYRSYDKESVMNNVAVDDIAVNLEFALNNCIALYDNADVKCINSILKFIDKACTGLYELKKSILDTETYSALGIKNPHLIKVKKK